MNRSANARPLDFLTEYRTSLFVDVGNRFNTHMPLINQDYGHLELIPLPWLDSVYHRRWLLRFLFDAFLEEAKVFIQGNLYGLVFDGWILVYIHKKDLSVLQIGDKALWEGISIKRIRNAGGSTVAKTYSDFAQLSLPSLDIPATALLHRAPFHGLYPINLGYVMPRGKLVRFDFTDQNGQYVVDREYIYLGTGPATSSSYDTGPGEPPPIQPKLRKDDGEDEDSSKEG